MKILYTCYIFLCATCVCLFLGAHLGWHGWSVEHVFKPIDTLALLVNAAIALVIQSYIARRGTNDRVEKDLVIADIKETISEVENVHALFDKRAESEIGTLSAWKELIRGSKKISLSLDRLDSTLDVVTCKTCKNLGPGTASIKKLFVQYKKVVTDQPPVTTISATAVASESIEYAKLMKSLKRLIISINSH